MNQYIFLTFFLNECFKIRHLIYSHFLLYRICTFPIVAHVPYIAYLNVNLSLASVRAKPTMDADVDIHT